MSADDGRRGGSSSASSLLRPVSSKTSATATRHGEASSSSLRPQPATRHDTTGPNKPSSHAQQPSTSKADSSTSGTLDLPSTEDVARNELLRDSVFPEWKDDSGGDMVLESPDELQKKDPLGTQIWKLYSRTKTRLPNQERMENLTWRMMAMNLRRREQMQAAYEPSVTLETVNEY